MLQLEHTQLFPSSKMIYVCPSSITSYLAMSKTMYPIFIYPIIYLYLYIYPSIYRPILISVFLLGIYTYLFPDYTHIRTYMYVKRTINFLKGKRKGWSWGRKERKGKRGKLDPDGNVKRRNKHKFQLTTCPPF